MSTRKRPVVLRPIAWVITYLLYALLETAAGYLIDGCLLAVNWINGLDLSRVLTLILYAVGAGIALRLAGYILNFAPLLIVRASTFIYPSFAGRRFAVTLIISILSTVTLIIFGITGRIQPLGNGTMTLYYIKYAFCLILEVTFLFRYKTFNMVCSFD